MRSLRKPALPSRALAAALVVCLLLANTACTRPDTAFLPSPASQVSFEAGFSPGGTSLEIILKAINNAEESIFVAAYSFTSKPIATALLEACKRGVAVRVVADSKANKVKYSAATFLANHGVPVRLNSRYAIFHHKFMIIDSRHLETGSFNYSAAAANRNAENVLLLREVPELAALYAREWDRLWAEGEEARARY
jgi:phosphatidylserine/phosphatidylglycerophosphate/cardiolipin synthase-like enzyme